MGWGRGARTGTQMRDEDRARRGVGADAARVLLEAAELRVQVDVARTCAHPPHCASCRDRIKPQQKKKPAFRLLFDCCGLLRARQ